MINESLQVLNERELDIIQTRKLSDTPTTLEDLSEKYNISRERIRQIEVRALEKVKEALEQSMSERNIIDI
jgi:RNA polymerase sigma-32 factor